MPEPLALTLQACVNCSTRWKADCIARMQVALPLQLLLLVLKFLETNSRPNLMKSAALTIDDSGGNLGHCGSGCLLRVADEWVKHQGNA